MERLSAVALPAPILPYRVRLANILTDEPEVLRLCKAGALHCLPEKYEWNYAANPLRQAWCSLAIENASQSAVGTTALFPRRILVDGVPFSAAVSGDFAVHPRHRTLYPALALQKAAVSTCSSGGFEILYGFPNDAARRVQLRLGYRVMGSMCVGIRPLQVRRTLERSGHELNWLPGIGILDSLITLASKESRVRVPAHYSYFQLPAFDERFDRFWMQTLPRHRVVVERTSLYANWRFMLCPIRKYSLLAAIHSVTGEIGGYIVSWSDDGRVHVSDIVSHDDAFDGLLASFIRQQRELGAHCITIVYFGEKQLIHKMRRFGFVFRRTSSELLLYTRPNLPVGDELSCPDNWYLLDGDSDF